MTKVKFNIDHLSQSEFIRERIQPKPGDPAYLHLSDLLIAIKGVVHDIKGKLLDYGCGGSPYRSLFPNVEYLRADMPPSVNLDYIIQSDGSIDAPDQSFDAILSTQVLEHVKSYEKYLLECYRLLKPGGHLLLSTHGSFFDHGCPNDFRRWTSDGLTEDLVRAGFSVDSMQKLTTGIRGLLFLGEDYLGHLWASRREKIGLGLWFFQKWFWQNRQQRHQWIDRQFSENRIVSSEGPDNLYVCILSVSTRPSLSLDLEAL